LTEFLGILEITDRGAGFIRRRSESFLAATGDVHVPTRLIQQYRLRTGDEIEGDVGSAQERGRERGRRPDRGGRHRGNGGGGGGGGGNRGPELRSIVAVNRKSPDELVHRPDFTRLSAIHPNQQLMLDAGLTRMGQRDFTNRVIDLLCPFGKGQRALIVAPAKAGKTMVLQAIAEGIAKNYPAAALFILLVDERPEEVTEMESCGFGEVIASSFDHGADRHVAIAEITLERARRRVEQGEDVVLILDSITRLARAYNSTERGTGRTLTGGLDATSLEKPKRFLGSARAIDSAQGTGSLTIIGTSLIDTGSKMDQVIFEEFKGTGNSELTLSRELAERRIYPAIDLNASGTRKEELLLSPEALVVSQALRKRFSGEGSTEAMSQLLRLMKRTESNAELLKMIS
jgi:transcription termination factor Rho